MALANEILDTEFENPGAIPICRAELDLGDYALTQKGASASTNANHEPDADYPADAAINGDRTHKNWGAASDPRGGWKSGDIDVHGDAELTIDFGEDKIINRLEIFTYPKNALNDAIADTPLTSFEVQTKPDGGAFSTWTNLEDGGGGDGSCTIAAGVVSANTRTWNILTSPTEKTCRYIKLIITVVADTHFARICEVEAYRSINLTQDAYITAKDLETGDVANVSQNRLLDGRVTRRKDFNFNKFVAGQANLTLRNDDRKFSPLYIPTVDEVANQGYFNPEIRPELRIRTWEGFDQRGREELVQTGVFYVKTWDATSEPKQVTVTMRDRMSRMLRKIFDGPTTILENYEIEKLMEWVALRMNVSVDEMDLATTASTVPYFFPKDRQAWKILQDLAESLGFAAIFFDERGWLKYEYYLETLPHEQFYDTKDDWDLGTIKQPGTLDTAASVGDLQLKYDFLIDDFADGNYTANPAWTISTSPNPTIISTAKGYALVATTTGSTWMHTTISAQTNGTFEFILFDNTSVSAFGTGTQFIGLIKDSTGLGYLIKWVTIRHSGSNIERTVYLYTCHEAAGQVIPDTLLDQASIAFPFASAYTFLLHIRSTGLVLSVYRGYGATGALDAELTSGDTSRRDFDRLYLGIGGEHTYYYSFLFYPDTTYVQDQNWDGPATGVESLRGMTEIDYMEYANDVAAQAAWVTSKAPVAESYRDEFDDASLDAFWNESIDGLGTIAEAGGVVNVDSDNANDAAVIWAALQATYDFKFALELKGSDGSGALLGIYRDSFDGVGSNAHINAEYSVHVQVIENGADCEFSLHYISGGGNRYYWDEDTDDWGAANQTKISYTGAMGTKYVFRFIKDGTKFYFGLYSADELTTYIDPAACWVLKSAVRNGSDNGKISLGGDTYTGAHWGEIEYDWVDGLYKTADAVGGLQDYSEDTEKVQGTHSLKVIADQTDSLNERIVRDLGGGTLDWSGKDVVSIWVRASRAAGGPAANFAFYFGETAWDDQGPYVIDLDDVVPDTYGRIFLDISGVADADKNAVRYLAFKIINADAGNVIYLDAMGFYEYTKLGQQFTPATDNVVGKISLNLTKVGSPSGNVWVEIQTDDGTNEPSGVVRATSELVACSGIAAGPGWVDFEFLSIPLATNANLYHVVLKADYAYSTINYIDWNYDDAAPTYTDGDGSYFAEGADDWATFTDQDFLFREYYISAGFPISQIHEGWWIGPNIDTGVTTPTKWDPFEFDFLRDEGQKANIYLKFFTQVAADDAGSPGVWDDYVEIAGWDGTEYTYQGTQIPQSALKQWIRPIVYFRGRKWYPQHWTPLLHWIRLNWWTGGGNTVPEKAYDLLENGTLLNAKMRFASEEGGRGKIYKRAIIKAKRRYRQSYEDVWEFQEGISLVADDDITYNVDLDDPCQPDTTGAHQMELYVDETNDATFNPATEIDNDGDGTDNTSVANLTVTFTRHPTKPTIRLQASGNVTLYGMKVRAKPYKVVAPIEARAEAPGLNQVDYEGEDMTYENEFLATRALAEAIAADVIANASKEEAYLVNTTIRYCPALQIGDIVYAKDHHLGINHYFQIFGYNRSFGARSMAITARRTSLRGLETPGSS